MIPFERCLPYDQAMGDLFLPECPFCGEEQVLLPMKPLELPEIRDGRKRLLVFPCCRNKVTLLDADNDYLLTDTVIRRTGG
ncbi:hypothetical protein PA598K_04943 [Paenibacillus sp. 598K]|uniref:hypothetical protein n=1 Tax=Paenibacillus sp. 598K TaxID=1117987 RepID=UPI000FF8FFBC|nr:hypothetical protein [Paenibacillus sp. 598K]GBF76469.1 hypothetical protein PA598K_04943 [Paenibacillus sp. 598K]